MCLCSAAICLGCVELCTGRPTDKWIQYCLKLLDILLDAGVHVYLVFDGSELPAKRATEVERLNRRAEHREKGLQLLAQGRQHDARCSLSKAVDITPAMAAQFISVVRAHRPSNAVTCVVAPYEADAQLAFLSHCGAVDAVVTEDSDSIPFGCKEVLFKLERVKS